MGKEIYTLHTNLNKNEINILLDLLEEFSDKLSSQTYNDYPLENNEANRKLFYDMNNNDDEWDDWIKKEYEEYCTGDAKIIGFIDWLVVDYLAGKIKKGAKRRD